MTGRWQDSHFINDLTETDVRDIHTAELVELLHHVQVLGGLVHKDWLTPDQRADLGLWLGILWHELGQRGDESTNGFQERR